MCSLNDALDLFGSDDEDENGGLFIEDHSLSSDANLHTSSQRCMSSLADACVLHLITSKQWSRSSVSLTQRVLALPKQSSVIFSTDALLNTIRNYWFTALSQRLREKGLVSYSPEDMTRRDGCHCICDAAILFRSCAPDCHHPDKDHDEEDKIIRKALLPGCLLILTTHIPSITCNTNYDIGSVRDILSLWSNPHGGSDIHNIFTEAVWDLEHAHILHDTAFYDNVINQKHTLITLALLKRPCVVNTRACPWKISPSNQSLPKTLLHHYLNLHPQESDQAKPSLSSPSWLQYERFILAQTTITPSVYECIRHGTSTATDLSSDNIQRCVTAIQTYGFCIIRNMFHPDMLISWTRAVLQDLDSACHLLQHKFSVDILHPHHYSHASTYNHHEPLSYKEMSMREDFRVDLRHGPCLHQCKQHHLDSHMDDDDDDDHALSNQPTIVPSSFNGSLQSLRFHPSILQIIRFVFNPIQDPAKTSIPLYKGNYGRWNFDGTGPDGSPQPLRVGQVGSIISLPNAADQAIHADTPHLFEHIDCLPTHYANLFIVGLEDTSCSVDDDGNPTGDSLVGGTAFIHGTHSLSVCASLTATDDYKDGRQTSHGHRSAAAMDSAARAEMYARIVRPSLQPGDALIFDCRVLHFGLANLSTDIRRPLLYVNMTQAWFHDPKNWDDRVPIFDSF
jgi:hypothetical protein